MSGTGAVRFIHGTLTLWGGPKSKYPGELGVEVSTPQGTAGFIFDVRELREFVAAATKHLEEYDRSGGRA